MSTERRKPEPLRSPDKHVPWLLGRIWDRINRENEHFMGVVVGQEGSGKSYTAIKIANEIDPSFTADRVIFDVAELLRVLKDGDHEPGHFYVLDEAGVQLGRRTWQDRAQVLANQALQLVRNHNLGLLFTLPRLGELDSQAQGRLQAFLELTDKEDGEYVRGKWKWMEPDRADETGKIYKKYPRRRKDGRIIRLTSVAFTPPPAELVEPYEERKNEFQDEFYEETIQALEGEEEEAEGEEAASPAEVAEKIVGNGLVEYISRHPQNKSLYIDQDLIAADYDMSVRKAKQTKKLIEREVDVDEYEEKLSA